jgi:hypothetical protein
MVDLSPQPFTTQQQKLVNVNWSDIAGGTGHITFYGGEVANGEYILSRNTFYSNSIQTKEAQALNTNTFEKVIDIDFDTPILNLSQTIKGTGYFSCPFGWIQTSATSETMEVYIIVKVRKWDGSSETEISNGQSKTLSKATSSVDKFTGNITAAVEIDKTYFAKGETIRITYELWSRHSLAAIYQGQEWFIGHDPKSRIDDDILTSDFDTGDNTSLELNIPFDID